MTDTLTPTLANMVLDNDGITNVFEYETQPNLTYKIHTDSERVSGHVDEVKAYEQAVYKLLSTERYKYLIYSWSYGIELEDLFGQPIPYVVPELERRITEAVMADDRTESVSDFEFDTSKRSVVHVKFKATSIFGEVKIELNVEI